VISPTQRCLPDNTQHSQETDIHAPSGIRTRNPSKRPQTHALARANTGIGGIIIYSGNFLTPRNDQTKCRWCDLDILFSTQRERQADEQGAANLSQKTALCHIIYTQYSKRGDAQGDEVWEVRNRSRLPKRSKSETFKLHNLNRSAIGRVSQFLSLNNDKCDSLTTRLKEKK
jgi:hypothetical protein